MSYNKCAKPQYTLYIGLHNDTCPQHVDNGTAAGSFYQILEISATRYRAYHGAGRSRPHITEVRSENWSDPPISAPTRGGLASRGLWSINSHHAHDATRQTVDSVFPAAPERRTTVNRQSLRSPTRVRRVRFFRARRKERIGKRHGHVVQSSRETDERMPTCWSSDWVRPRRVLGRPYKL